MQLWMVIQLIDIPLSLNLGKKWLGLYDETEP